MIIKKILLLPCFILISACAMYESADPEALRGVNLSSDYTIGVMVYATKSTSRRDDVTVRLKNPKTNAVSSFVGLPGPTVPDPTSVVGPAVVQAIEKSMGVRAKLVQVSRPDGYPDKIAMKEGPALGVDAILFMPFAGRAYLRGSYPNYSADFRVELGAKLFDVNGAYLWDEKLGDPDHLCPSTFDCRSVLGVYRVFEDNDHKINDIGDLTIKWNDALKDSAIQALERVDTIVSDIAADSR